MKLDGLLGVFEIIVTGKNKDFYRGIFLPDPGRQGQTIHIGHPDVRHDYIRFQLFQLLQRIPSVLRVACHRKSQLFPVHLADHGLADLLLVVYQHNAI